MNTQDYSTILQRQRDFFATGATKPIAFRIEQLRKIKNILQTHEDEIVVALKSDLHRSSMETIFTEILLVNKEIDLIIKHLKKWSSPKKVTTPFPLLWPGKSKIHYEPYGSVLIIGPWNYPLLLVMSPLIGAISAGNCAVVKASEIAVNTQTVIAKLINTHFPAEFIIAINTDKQGTDLLLKEKFDYIFFTGGTQVGKIIMSAAANHLTPVTLELGGKNPCIVDETADLNFAARRIILGKLTNAGQICLAPDYLYVHASIKDVFIQKLKNTITQFFGTNPKLSDSFGRIINASHFDRITQLMKCGKIIAGGQTDAVDRYIAPTLITDVSWGDPIMQEEIFGPLLPIFSYDNLNDVVITIKSHPKPLACYLFSKCKMTETKVMNEISFGGGCVNDCLGQMLNCHLPFGGVGLSGMGNYHGKHSFETFSHQKSIYKKSLPVDIKLEYPPYNMNKLWWIKQLLKL